MPPPQPYLNRMRTKAVPRVRRRDPKHKVDLESIVLPLVFDDKLSCVIETTEDGIDDGKLFNEIDSELRQSIELGEWVGMGTPDNANVYGNDVAISKHDDGELVMTCMTRFDILHILSRVAESHFIYLVFEAYATKSRLFLEAFLPDIIERLAHTRAHIKACFRKWGVRFFDMGIMYQLYNPKTGDVMVAYNEGPHTMLIPGMIRHFNSSCVACGRYAGRVCADKNCGLRFCGVACRTRRRDLHAYYCQW